MITFSEIDNGLVFAQMDDPQESIAKLIKDPRRKGIGWFCRVESDTDEWDFTASDLRKIADKLDLLNLGLTEDEFMSVHRDIAMHEGTPVWQRDESWHVNDEALRAKVTPKLNRETEQKG